MEVKELRVGNLVNIKDHFVGGIAKVTGIMYDRITAVNSVGTNIDTINIMYVEPIPITEKLLLKNGFIDNGKGQFYYHLKDNGKTTIRCATDDYKNWFVMVDSMRYENFIITDVSNDNVQYIHELQNVIQMAKVDKEIKF